MSLSRSLGAHTMRRIQAVYAGRRAVPRCQVSRGLEADTVRCGLEPALPSATWERILCAAPRLFTREEGPLLDVNFLAAYVKA